jgi:amino acid permease
MESLKQNKILLSIFAIVVIIFLGYHFFGSDITESIVTNTENQDSGSEFVVLLEKLKQVDINDNLFKSTAWTNLVDFSIVLPQDAPGKTDLFSKVGQIESFQPQYFSTTTKATTPTSGVKR